MYKTLKGKKKKVDDGSIPSAMRLLSRCMTRSTGSNQTDNTNLSKCRSCVEIAFLIKNIFSSAKIKIVLPWIINFG